MRTSARITVGLVAVWLAFALCACAGPLGASVEQVNDGGSSRLEACEFRNVDLGNGWQVERSLQVDYATQFTVDYFAGGFALACLSDGARYLAVPEGAKAPEGLEDDIVVLQRPLADIYLVASDTACIVDALGELDAVTVSGIAQDDWHVAAMRDAMQDGRIAYGGKYRAPDYDLLVARGCKLSIQSTMIDHTPDVREKLVELGIPVLTEHSSQEAEPLGRCEWVKLYGALFGKDDLARDLFGEQVAHARLSEGDHADTGKTVAFFYINSNGAAVARKPGDYVTKMIERAGGSYIFDDLGDDSATSTVTLEMERFYAQARDADVIVYNATIDGGVSSIDDLVSKNALLADFKAVKSGDVWLCGQDMYQQMTSTGDIIADFAHMLRGDACELSYLRRLS